MGFSGPSGVATSDGPLNCSDLDSWPYLILIRSARSARRRMTTSETYRLVARLDSSSMWHFGPAESARARAVQAQAREIEAHRRAINLQESSAIMFDRAHQPRRSRNARERAEHALEALRQALAEQEAFEKGPVPY